MTRQQAAVWAEQARQWQHVGQPLRPGIEDIATFRRFATQACHAAADGFSVLVLGMTPELVSMGVPRAAKLVAVDHSSHMIQSLWAPPAGVDARAIHASWHDIPLPSECVEVALGDNPLGVLPTVFDYEPVLTELRRLLGRGGNLVLRCFVSDAADQDLSLLPQQVAARRITSFHALKWRIAMALARAPDFSVPVQLIHDSFSALFPDRAALCRSTGWAPTTVETIDAYSGSPTRYSFPTLTVLRDVLAPHFHAADEWRGEYELAERCPVIRWKAR